MTIKIVGQTEGRERTAAEELAVRLRKIIKPDDTVIIVAGAKCYGEKRQDIDLLVFGAMSKGFRIKSDLVPQEFAAHKIYLTNFLLTLEVKDHGPESIRFTGNQVEVRYEGRWSNASNQAFEQVHSVRNYIGRALETQKSPWIISGLWLRNFSKAAIPKGPHNILGSDLDADRFLQFIIQNRHDTLSWQVGRGRIDLSISAFDRTDAAAFQNALNLFTKNLEQSFIDRRKLEVVCQKILKDQQYADRIGSQLLLFRGRGGAGKTLRLLQIAKTLHDDFGHRILFLTYNKSLVADVRRLLSILGIGDKIDDRTIAIRSSDSFFFGLLAAYDLRPCQQVGNQFPIDYLQKKQEMLDLLRLSNPTEIRKERTAIDNPDCFAWDFILVDEGQDWPQEERDILFALFGPEHLIVADGVDQFVRDQLRCDWTHGAPTRQIVTLKKSLRLKKNLCRLATAFANASGIEWDMEANDEIPGGCVKLVLGQYTREVHTKVMDAHNSAGNKAIDALICVTGASGAASARFPEELKSWGAEVWNGMTSEGRSHFPTDVGQYRIVKYESCRGLEGWTVVCLDLDQFFDRQIAEGKTRDRELFVAAEEAGERFAAQWCLIPFTRAIDTLVLQLHEESALAKRLLPIARDYKDFVEIIRTH